ncbi:cyclic nucleotide-binding protein [Methylovorus sp. MM2]|uniref:cyclic nucleotide-binding domain-containing protein n=1 Tax=Methylovorus sp. MM2 TaxID=1848038 RepID=UPI0007DF3F23|nr:cyclic nucleotide-binding domain-containing protein [Methylovorus sp. MM2]OAM51395.1 cyclic nucleotide-binding protein [Methylovorus sp. MM2]
MASVETSLIAQLEPISTLSAGRLKELAGLCFVEKVSKDIDPLRMNITKSAQSIYLIQGELGLQFADGTKKVMRGGGEAAKHPIDANRNGLQNTIALTDIEIIRIDLDLLDIMMTWDQLADFEKPLEKTEQYAQGRGASAWMNNTGAFSASKLQSGVFSRLPTANIDEMFRRMTSVNVKAGQVIIKQGAEGDYYYLIESGIAVVSRIIEAGQPPLVLAQLESGDTFGEEALVSENKRNASITMNTDGVLLRLNKKDFVELLKAPLINQISLQDATSQVANGAIWLDVRLSSEFDFYHQSNAVNLPLNLIRTEAYKLDRHKQYIVYCHSGRRSSAAAFILINLGFNVMVLQDGIKGHF